MKAKEVGHAIINVTPTKLILCSSEQLSREQDAQAMGVGLKYSDNNRLWLTVYINILLLAAQHPVPSALALWTTVLKITIIIILFCPTEKKGQDHDAIFALVEKKLREKYDSHILPHSQMEWIFVNAGGWMGSMCVLHASTTEYVLFFGTAVDTSGHSG